MISTRKANISIIHCFPARNWLATWFGRLRCTVCIVHSHVVRRKTRRLTLTLFISRVKEKRYRCTFCKRNVWNAFRLGKNRACKALFTAHIFDTWQSDQAKAILIGAKVAYVFTFDFVRSKCNLSASTGLNPLLGNNVPCLIFVSFKRNTLNTKLWISSSPLQHINRDVCKYLQNRKRCSLGCKFRRQWC